MIIFSQGIGHHSRIGNSLAWMARARQFLTTHGVEACFPYAHDTFKSYLSNDNYWLNEVNFLSASETYMRYFEGELTKESIASLSRALQVRYEEANNFKAFEWDSIVYWPYENEVLFISGAVNFSDNALLEKIKKTKLVIVHEPFPFNITPIVQDLPSILPRNDLYVSEMSYVSEVSDDKKRLGFHIRRGDYAQWDGGKYYFSDEYWVDLISENAAACNSKIWLFSNVEIKGISDTLSEMRNIDFIVSKGDFCQDFVRLMCMNTIFGPPSTFTALAVSLGQILQSEKIKLTFLK
ncbi:hypothetical protein G6671_02385 [Polynucleobacter paneuropaeus]|nr:hypothetical protein G6671_02385 [Polynucleobacter paneuropaeus]